MKKFSILTVLSVTTDRLLCPIGELYDILGWLTDDSPYTHQLVRFADECKPYILKEHPQLEEVTEYVAKECEAGNAATLCKEMVAKFGNTIALNKISPNAHQVKCPIQEIEDLRKGSS